MGKNRIGGDGESKIVENRRTSFMYVPLGKIPDFLSHHNSLFSAVDSGGAGGARAPAEFGGSEKGQSLISVSEFSYYYEHPRI